MVRAFFLAVAVVIAITAHGLSPVQQVYDQLRLLSSSTLSYRYMVSLIDLRTGTVIDSNGGRLYRSGTAFVDSNKEFYTAISNDYFCKVDKLRKLASVYKLDVIKRKLGIDPQVPSSAINFVDSIGFKSLLPAIDSTPRNYYRVTWQLASSGTSSFCIWVDKKNYRLLTVIITTREYVDAKHSYDRICVIRDISTRTSGESIDLNHIFRIQANKVIMTSKYADYTVKSLINI